MKPPKGMSAEEFEWELCKQAALEKLLSDKKFMKEMEKRGAYKPIKGMRNAFVK
jgi:hypothetical protein